MTTMLRLDLSFRTMTDSTYQLISIDQVQDVGDADATLKNSLI